VYDSEEVVGPRKRAKLVDAETKENLCCGVFVWGGGGGETKNRY